MSPRAEEGESRLRGFLREGDRVSGLLIVVLALSYGFGARGFQVGFVADPVGPRAVPYVLAGLLGVLGLILVARPGDRAAWPSSSVWIRLIAALGSLLLYALLLVPLGFVLATIVEVAFLSFLFDGPPLPSLAAAVALGLALYGLFDYALGLRLPAGPL